MNKMAPLVSLYRVNFTNRANCMDVDGDGFVVSLDRLRIINFLNDQVIAKKHTDEIAKFTDARSIYKEFGALDVNHDGYVAGNDALYILNHLNNPNDYNFSPSNPAVCVPQ
jgi:hypothetical protein